MSKKEPFLNDVSCPRCGCWMARNFKCDCGDVHGDYCDNCNRWTSLKRDEYLEMSPWDKPCNQGMVKHNHIFDNNITKYFDKSRQENPSKPFGI